VSWKSVQWPSTINPFVSSGISGDNWTNLVKPSEYTYSLVLQNIGQYWYQLFSWHINLTRVVRPHEPTQAIPPSHVCMTCHPL
jgi:hypothetical protein